ncbi:UrcA family protein [Sphingobium sp. WCS2017Hpa-17]|uniref:UrcA family protein n=1 Tax=Sphingobium sp. WCS2017Hpa-17 TaxID=3073638 RepID=UPI0028891A08|nr:UrcA family protein [Sphingobium sp. WCS2017Hpa-17]
MFVSTKIAAALASVALLASAGAASAQEFQSNGRTTGVYHGDLDLTNATHQQQLRSRIARAANRVCSSMDLQAQQTCKAKAIAHVQAPISAAIARAETGERYADAGKPVLPVVGN